MFLLKILPNWPMGMCVLFLTMCNIPIGQYDIVVHSIILTNMHCTTICKIILSHK
jgi:hypothetical protein